MTGHIDNPTLDEAVRTGLATIFDLLLPGTEKLPSGRSIGAHLEWLDRVLEADPRLVAVVIQAGEAASQSDSCSLDEVAVWVGADLDALIFTLHAAYYMAPEVRAVLGYPGQTRRPISLAKPDEVVSDELLAPVKQRGSVYVPTPG